MRALKHGRRHFLAGAGGFTLALPLLPSLLPQRAKAGDYPYAEHPRFVAFTTNHGGLWGQNMYPGDEVITGTETIYPGHEMNYGALVRNDMGATSSLSPVLTASSDLLSDEIVARMNVIRGLDITFYIAHHYGGHLGNYGRGVDPEGGLPALPYRPTIDQVMAYSDSFYPDVSMIRERSMQLGFLDISWAESATGSVDPVPRTTESLALFNQIFDPDAPPDEFSDRTPVVDRVLEHYQSLRSGSFGDGKRLSVSDQNKLDDHMERLFELQSKLSAQLPASCAEFPVPTGSSGEGHPGYYDNASPSDVQQYYSLMNDVIAAAFICGTSRIATVSLHQIWNTYGGDWHQEIAHECHASQSAQDTQVQSHRSFFEGAYLDLVNKLNVEEENGVTVLDNSLVMWTQESGIMTHDSDSMPVVTAGSAAGYFQTGQFLDYRDRTNMALTDDAWTEVILDKRPGVAYNRWLANILQAMNIGPEEYEVDGLPGYGVVYNENTTAWPQRIYDDASDPLPHLVAE